MANAYASSDFKKVASLYNDPFWSLGQGKAIGASELERWVEGIRATSMPKDYAAFRLTQLSSKPLGTAKILFFFPMLWSD